LCISILFGYCKYNNATYVGYGIVSQKNSYKAEPPFIIEAFQYYQGKVLAKKLKEKLNISGNNDTDLEKLILWIFRQNLQLEMSLSDGYIPVVDDNYFNLLKRGFGHCDQYAGALAAIATHVGFTSRLRFLLLPNNVSPHTIAEVKIGNRWILVDTTFKTYLKNENGILLGIEDYENYPKIFTNYFNLIKEHILLINNKASIPESPEFYYYSNWDISLYRRGTPFYTFPYCKFNYLCKKIFFRLFGEIPFINDAFAGNTQEIYKPPFRKEVSLYDEARLFTLLEDFKNAEMLYSKVIELEGMLKDEATFYRGYINYLLGEKKSARKDFFSLIKQNKNNTWSKTAKTMLYLIESNIDFLSIKENINVLYNIKAKYKTNIRKN